MNELVVTQKNGSIECNFTDIKAELQLMMSAYTSLEITEEGIKEAKKDLATLRKIKTAVDGKRKEVKASFMQPYTAFENDVKDLISVIDEPISMIDGKLKEFEVKRIQEKQIHLKELYDENIGEFSEYLPFEAVKNPKWDNSSYSDKDVKYDLSEAIMKVRSEINAIKALNSEIEEECLKVYKNSGNSLTAAIQKNTDYQNAKVLAQKKLEEEKRAEQIKEEPLVEKKEESVEQVVLPEETTFFTFRVYGEENIQKVKEYLDFADIEYKGV